MLWSAFQVLPDGGYRGRQPALGRATAVEDRAHRDLPLTGSQFEDAGADHPGYIQVADHRRGTVGMQHTLGTDGHRDQGANRQRLAIRRERLDQDRPGQPGHDQSVRGRLQDPRHHSAGLVGRQNLAAADHTQPHRNAIQCHQGNRQRPRGQLDRMLRFENVGGHGASFQRLTNPGCNPSRFARDCRSYQVFKKRSSGR